MTLYHAPRSIARTTQLLSLGRAIEISLSEDPDLATLEDDADDLYGQAFANPGSTASSNTGGGGGFHDSLSSKRASGSIAEIGHAPLRSVHYRNSPLPCFSGSDLLSCPPLPSDDSSASHPVTTDNAAKGGRRPPEGGDSDHRHSYMRDTGDENRQHRSRALPAVTATDAFPTVAQATAATTTTTADTAAAAEGFSASARDSFPSLSDLDAFEGGGLSLSPSSRLVHKVGQENLVDGALDNALGDSFDGAPGGTRRGFHEKSDESVGSRGGGNSYRAGLLMVGSGRSVSGPGGGFVSLREAFGRQGRAERGIEEMRRRGTGGSGSSVRDGRGHELAVLDGMHASFRVQNRHHAHVRRRQHAEAWEPSETEVVGQDDGRSLPMMPSDRGIDEIGIRTSMMKGNRWVIGRRTDNRGGGSHSGTDGGEDSRERGGHFDQQQYELRDDDISGELYATVDAPILSVGDARAAVNRLLSWSATMGSGGDEVDGVHGGAARGKVLGNGDDAHGSKGQGYGIGRGRRRYLR